MVLLTIVESLVALLRTMHLKCCLTTRMKLKRCKCKQLSLELTLTLGWPLVTKPILPLQAEVVNIVQQSASASMSKSSVKAREGQTLARFFDISTAWSCLCLCKVALKSEIC